MHAPRANDLLRAAARMGSMLLFGLAPVAAVVGVITVTIDGAHPFYDFAGTVWAGGRAILHGHDPYPLAFLDRLVQIKRAGGSPSLVYAVPVYPAPTLVAMLPLALLPARLAGLLLTIASLAALVAGLRLFGVRDWRCHGAALISWPALQSIRLGALEPILILALAVVWRGHRNGRITGPVCASAAIAKLFLWPVAAWLVMTRRWRAARVGAAFAILVMLGGWAAISFAGMAQYPRLLSDVTTLEASGGVSSVAAGLALGISRTAAEALSILIGGAILCLAAWAARREQDEARALGLVVMAALVASPVVWAHYLTLLYVPIALVSPELSMLWLAPLLLYLSPVELTHGDLGAIGPYLVVEAWVVGALLRPTLRRVRVHVAARANPRGGSGTAAWRLGDGC